MYTFHQASSIGHTEIVLKTDESCFSQNWYDIRGISIASHEPQNSYPNGLKKLDPWSSDTDILRMTGANSLIMNFVQLWSQQGGNN